MNDNEVNPITILTGINGNGKTTLLEFIYDIFKKQNFSSSNKKSFIDIEVDNLLDSKSIIQYYKINFDFLKKNKNNFKFNLSEKVFFYKAGEENSSAKNIITSYIDELIYEKDIKSSHAYEQVQKTLNETLSSINLQVEFLKLDKNKEIFFKNKYSEQIKLKDLSGGEKEMLTKVFPLFISPVKDSIILIDEPESSLHPNWQNEIIDLYYKIAVNNNNQFIVATHSPHIVSAVKNKFIKILVKENDGIKVIDTTSNSYGKKVDEILLDIFKINGLRTPVIENKLSRLKELIFQKKTDTLEFKGLLSELENSIGKFDSDLAMIKLDVLKSQIENETNI
jgi:predicted ATPase